MHIYPNGTRVRLSAIDDPPYPYSVGEYGEIRANHVVHVDIGFRTFPMPVYEVVCGRFVLLCFDYEIEEAPE